MKRALSIFLSVLMVLSVCVTGASADSVSYKITNPYESVTALLGDASKHYRTNLHTHSTISDASEDYATMIKGYYDAGFDILGFADHGVLGRYWNEEPEHNPLFAYQYIAGNKVTKLTDDEYNGIVNGTYACTEGSRTYGRGMQCVPKGIELNNVTLTKCHVNGYFCDYDQGGLGFENAFEYVVKRVDKAGGISVINHPGDWIESRYNEDAARDPANVRLFGDILNKYKTCCGIEVLNNRDSITHNDRILWDELLQYVIPHGERNVYGFGNSDAHELKEIETAFMDFILPEYSLDNVRSCMENGTFFACSRMARNELGWDFKGTGAYPTVTSIAVDDENDIITVTAKNTEKLEWIANGKVILTSTDKNENGEVVSVINLREYSSDITCYVRFQAMGEGGICMSQAFILDDGNMSRFIVEDPRTDSEKTKDRIIYILKSTRFYCLFQELYRLIAKEFS